MTNYLYYGDNLDVLRESIGSETIDLVYLDPPFNSNRSYNVLFKNKGGDDAQAQLEAFDDTWTWSQEAEQEYEALASGGAPAKVADAIAAMRRLLGDNDVLAYLVMMTPRLVELHRVLKPTGSLYLHCDPTASHYLKVVLDAIFGPKMFRNEIIWRYRTGGASKKHLARKHDVILFYTKTDDYTFNPQKEKSYTKSKSRKPGVVNYGAGTAEFFEDEEGVYNLVNMTDVWEISYINSQAAERLGYPTQKPLALLRRILEIGSNPGDVVLDPFCGCGTTVDAAEEMGRSWIGIDITYIAVDLIEKRLRDTHGDDVMDRVRVHGIPQDVRSAHALFQHSPFDFERWAVSMVRGQPNEKQVGDRGIDGIIRFQIDRELKEVGRVVVSVKGGKNPGPTAVRDLAGTVDHSGAQMGVLVTLEEPTPRMREAVNHSGSYVWPVNGESYPKVQIITVSELFEGKRPNMPALVFRPYIEAKRQMKPAAENVELF